MYLSDRQIKKLGEKGMIEPYTDDQLQSGSYDCKLSETLYDPAKGEYYNINDRPIIESGEFILASTAEHVKIPPHIVCQVWGKSSNARKGLFIHTTAGWVDPGFSGDLTLELFNCSRNRIDLRELRGICQLTFARMDDEPINPYDGHYQDQKGVTKAYF